MTGDITIFSPDLMVPLCRHLAGGRLSVRSAATMSVEARYLGARSADNWRTNNYNELNIIENGFLDEFKLAMANLQANNAAGGTRAGSFAYFGPGSGTAPLPIFLALLQRGESRERAATQPLYTSANFRSTTYLNAAGAVQPASVRRRDALDGDATGAQPRARPQGCRRTSSSSTPICSAAPTSSRTKGARCTTRWRSSSGAARRMGLSFQSSYVFGHATQSQFLSLRLDSPMLRNGGAEGDITHAFKLNAVYPLPFGSGQRFASNAGAVLDRLIGGWQIAGNARIQSGRLLDLGNVRLVGMDPGRPAQGCSSCASTGKDGCSCCRRTSSTKPSRHSASAPTSANGYGNAGRAERPLHRAGGQPRLHRVDPRRGQMRHAGAHRARGRCSSSSTSVSVKRVEVSGGVNAEFRLDALNVFDHVNFSPVSGLTATTNRVSGSAPASYEINALTGVNTARVMQIVMRLRW